MVGGRSLHLVAAVQAMKTHDGCDVRLVIDEGEACDVRLAVTRLEENPTHTNCLTCWAELLLRYNRAEYTEPPPPAAPCLAEPGIEARLQAMEDRANRVRCQRCGWAGIVEQLVAILVTKRPRRGCPWCGGAVTISPVGLRHADDCSLCPVDRAVREVTRGRNGREIPGDLRATT